MSYLSAYISRGVISTKFILKTLLDNNYNPAHIEKFIQELAWRDYWQQIWVSKGNLINSDLKHNQFPVSNSMQNSQTNYSPNSLNSNNLATEDDLRIIEDNIIYLQEQIEKFDDNNNSEKNQWMTDFLNKELQEQKELNALFKSLKERDNKNETET